VAIFETRGGPLPVQLPAALPPGVHTLVALGAAPTGEPRAMKLTVTVGAHAAAGRLPVTGAPVDEVVLTGLLAVLAGLILLQQGRPAADQRPARAGVSASAPGR
jgi:hypothetical protein